MYQHPLDTYDDFIVTPEGKRIYSGVGYLHLPNETALPCQFECGQTKGGRILYKCWFSEKHFNAVSWWLILPPTFYGSGQANNQKIQVIVAQFIRQIKEEYAILFSARELSVEYPNMYIPIKLKFHVTNFEFERPLHWTIDGHNIVLTHSKVYQEIIDRKELNKGVDITAELSINFLFSDAMCYTARMEGIVNDICHLLSFASGYKVEWLFWDALAESGQRVKSYHKKSWTTPCTSHSLIHDEFEKFIDQTFDAFRKRNREEEWRLHERINHYVAALEECGFIELRALMLVVLVEDLVGSYASQHGRTYFIEPSKFDKKEECLKRGIKEVLTQVLDPSPSLNEAEEMAKNFRGLNRPTFKTLIEELMESLQLNIDKRELREFLDIRNKLVHEARFLRPDERRGKHKERVMLTTINISR